MSVILYSSVIWERLHAAAKQNPDKVCLRSRTGVSLTYRLLIAHIDALAHSFVHEGMRRGDTAFFLARPSVEGIVHFLAVMRAGGVVVAADPAMGRESFKSRFAIVSSKWLVIEPVLLYIRRVPYLQHVLRAIGIEIPDIGPNTTAREIPVRRSRGTAPGNIQEVRIDDCEDALIVFTSGTTAAPRGVVHSYASVAATLALIESDLTPAPEDIFLASQIYFLFIALLSGATAVLPKNHRFDPEAFVHDLVAERITKAYALPAECELIIAKLKHEKARLPARLKTLMLGSAPIHTGFLKRLQTVTDPSTDVLCIYGSTEILPISRIRMSEKIAYKGEGDILGRPFSGVRVRLEGEEIVVSGNNLCSRYYGEESLLESRTGDLGRVEDGSIVLLGRKKDMIIRGNYNIYPALFESVIDRIEGVRASSLIGIYDEHRSDERIILAVETDGETDGAAFSATLMRELKAGPHSIDAYALPDAIVCMQLPRSGRSQKIDKLRLRKTLANI